jgi:hypothetical protein
MHISNDRYFLDRERHDLALRMIRHEARTCTIRSCTGLTDDRIRRLYKTYAHHTPSAPIRRRRGKSPRQPAYFLRSLRAQHEASLLASTLSSFGLIERRREAASRPIAYARLFCDAYETHLQLFAAAGLAPQISFEHAWFLLTILCEHVGLRRIRCRRCDGAYLRDPVHASPRGCPMCALKVRRARSRRASSGGFASRGSRLAPELLHSIELNE